MKYSLLIIASLIFYGCAGSMIPKSNPENFLGYQDRSPVPVAMVTIYDSLSKGEKKIFWEEIKDSEKKRKLLPIQSAKVSIKKTDISGGIGYLGSGLSAEKGSYEVVMDYMKYKVDNVYENGKVIGSGHIGVGFRIRANVVTTKAKLNIGSLGSLGVEAGLDNLKGSISVEIIGIDSENVTNLIPLTSEINQTSIQSALQALAAIKSKLWEDRTTITPHLVALKQDTIGKLDEISNQILTVTYFKTPSSDIIQNYWKPNGIINVENEKKILDWFACHNLDNISGFITVFLVGEEFVNQREQLINDLKIE